MKARSLFAFVGLLTPDGILIEVNRAPLEAVGTRREEVIGRYFWDLESWAYSPAVQQRLRESVGKAFRGESVRFDVEIQTKRGEILTLDFMIVPLRDESGTITHLIPTGVPITERKRAEEALRQSEAKLRAVFNSLVEGVVFINPDGVIEEANDAVTRSFGHTLEDIRNPATRGRAKAYRPDGSEMPDEELPSWRALRNREVVSNVEMGIPLANGEISWRLASAHPVVDDRGNLLGAVGSFFDITDRKKTVEALRESEIRFREAFENAAVGMALVHMDGRWLRVNHRLCEILGYSQEELLARTFGDVTHPDDLEADWALARQVAAGEIPTYTLEKRYIHKDGHTVWSNLTVSMLRDGAGNPLHYISFIEDITERKRAERALRVSEETLVSFFNNTPLPMGVVETTPNDILHISDNLATKQYFGSVSSGQWASELGVPQADIDIWLKHYRIAQATNHPVRFEFPFKMHGREGTLSVSVAFIHVSRTGRPRFSYVAEDITERKRAERQLQEHQERLRENESRLRGLAEAAPGILYSATPDGLRDFITPGFLQFTGLPLQEALGWGWLRAVHPEDVMSVRKHWRHCVQTGEPFEKEYRLRRHDGVYHWFISRARPIRDADGSIVKWFGTTVDIESQKQTELALRMANDDLNRFAFAAAHDLREPLRNIGAYSDMLVTRFGDHSDRTITRAREVIQEGVERMDQLLADLLDYTHATSTESTEDAVDCNVALAKAIENLQQAVVESGAEIDSGTLPQVTGHESQMVRIFQNLLGNAVKYRGSNSPRIQVSAWREDGSWVFSVRDNGVGISPEFRRHIFGMFKRLHGREIPGTGMGLAICAKIIESRGGKIWVESEPGGGSDFRFTWPLHKRSSWNPAAEDGGESGNAGGV
jgi:PAS domain S-box-containing protein